MSSSGTTTVARPRVAIIGGGAAGLAAARVLSRDNDGCGNCLFRAESVHCGGLELPGGEHDVAHVRGLAHQSTQGAHGIS